MQYRWKRNTAIFLSGQAISLFGSSLVQYAITWHITLTTKSGLFAMLSILCGFLPTFFLSPFAGIWADRYNRKLLIMLSDGGIALATLLLAILWMNGVESIYLLLVIMGIRALGSAVQQPCVGAMLPTIVPTEHLTRVNGLNGSMNSLITLLSPMLSGALMGFAPLYGIFFIDVVTAAAAIGVLLFFFRLPATEKAERKGPSDTFGEMKEGISYVFKTPFLRNFFALGIPLWLMTGPVAFLTPLQVVRSFGDDVWRLTAIEVAFSVGMLAGGLLISAWGGLKNRVHTIGLGSLAMGIGTVALGIRMPFLPYVIIMAVIGVSLPIFNTPSVVILQEKTAPEYMGRVFGVMTMLGSSLMPLSMLIFGPLADIVPIEYLLIGTGIVLAALSFAFVLNKPLLKAGIPAVVEKPEPI